MDVKKFCEERIVFCDGQIASEKMGGNLPKEEHAKGCKMAYQTVILALLDVESTEKSDNTSSLPFPDCRECKVRFEGCTTKCDTPTCRRKAVQKFDNEPETANID